MLKKLIGEKVQVYRNLNKGKSEGQPFASVRHVKVQTEYPRFVLLTDCTFTVRPAAQKKIQAGAAKEVHAWITGTLTNASDKALKVPSDFIPCNYNPRLRGEFYILSSGQAITQADAAIFLNGKIYCKNPR